MRLLNIRNLIAFSLLASPFTVQAFDFDAEMSGKSKPISRSHADDPFADVMQGRADIKDQNNQQLISRLKSSLNQSCNCSLTGNGCSRTMSLSNYHTEKRRNEAKNNLKELEQICLKWEKQRSWTLSSAEQRDAFTKYWTRKDESASLRIRMLDSAMVFDDRQKTHMAEERESRERQKARRSSSASGGYAAGIMVGLQSGDQILADGQRQIERNNRETARLERRAQRQKEREAEQRAQKEARERRDAATERRESARKERAREMQAKREAVQRQREAKARNDKKLEEQKQATYASLSGDVAKQPKANKGKPQKIYDFDHPVRITGETETYFHDEAQALKLSKMNGENRLSDMCRKQGMKGPERLTYGEGRTKYSKDGKQVKIWIMVQGLCYRMSYD